jgi:hypothetical protein
VNGEQLAFLDAIEADLTTAKAQGVPEFVPGRSRGRKFLRGAGVAGAVMAASVSFSALFAPAASAGTAVAVPRSVSSSCTQPDPIPRDHYKSCGSNGYYHFYRGSYTVGSGPSERNCYKFHSELRDLGCGHDPGRATTACE